MRYLSQLLHFRLDSSAATAVLRKENLLSIPDRVLNFLHTVKAIGSTPGMSGLDRSKLGIFNHLNFFQVVTGLIVSIIGIFYAQSFPMKAWLIASLPTFISIVVLVLNAEKRYHLALVVYFILYPVFTCISYINGISLGIELSFILYGILAVFFIKDIGYMVFAISFSMISYFILSVVWKSYTYQLEHINFVIYLINQGLAIVYIFYGLYLIKTENVKYNSVLQAANVAMQKQAEELEQLNSLKNKMFSVISHDLKSPLYALRNLFDNIQKQNIPAEEIKEMIPDVKNDLNYTVSLMENLLNWAKSQMKAHTVNLQEIDIKEMVEEILNLYYSQADVKNITIENHAMPDTYAYADRDMVGLVLRNLISNAIKFTPAGGRISVGTNPHLSFAEVYVKDTGKGISTEDMKKIGSTELYTTTGTAQEQGTGLGLMLCKEFLAKNGGQMQIESEEGKGSVFSFTLPVK